VKHLLLVTSGSELYRGYLLRSVADHYRVHLFSTTEPSWERDYLTGWTVLDSTLDAEVMIPAAEALNGSDPIDGVLCWDEARIAPAAALAAALRLPGGDPEVVQRCRDKHLTREVFAAAAVPQPKSALVETVDEALAAADRIGYPVVLKPRALAASLGVVLVQNPDELAERFAFTHDTTAPGAPHHAASVLVEEYADGPEISIDSVVYQGRVTPLYLAHKEVGYPPYFEEIGHVVDGADPLLTSEHLRRILDKAHAALGFIDGVTHVELRLTASGPKIIEVNGRLGGDLIPYLGWHASGVDPGLAAAAVACGLPPDIATDRKRAGGIRFFYVDHELVVGNVAFAGELPAAVDRAVVQVDAGAVVAPPPTGTLWGRIAFVTAVADSPQQCRRALDAAGRALRVTPLRADGSET
jgi:biotin carboxylase